MAWDCCSVTQQHTYSTVLFSSVFHTVTNSGGDKTVGWCAAASPRRSRETLYTMH
jgi:hypothetical protein